MGADHVGEITSLMKFVQPSIGVVTSIGPQHLTTFGSQEKHYQRENADDGTITKGWTWSSQL